MNLVQYQNVSDTFTPPLKQASLLRRSISTEVRRAALQDKKLRLCNKTGRTINHVIEAHQVLDVIGIERVEAALMDGVDISYLCSRLKLSRGQFNSWIHADRSRALRYARALNAPLYVDAVRVRGNIMKYGKLKEDGSEVLSKDDVGRLRLQLMAAKDIESATIPVELKEIGNGGPAITFDFGSIFGAMPPHVVNP